MATVLASCAASWRQVAGHHRLHDPGAEPEHRRARLEEPVPVRGAGSRPGADEHMGASSWRTRMGQDHEHFTDVTTDLQNSASAGDARHRPRQGEPARHRRPMSCARRSIPASACARSRRSTPRATAIRWSSSSIPAATGRRNSSTRSAFAPVAASWCRSAPSPRVERTAGPLTVNQLGQLPAVTISYNLPAGVALGASADAHRRDQEHHRIPASRSRPPSRARPRPSRTRWPTRAC